MDKSATIILQSAPILGRHPACSWSGEHEIKCKTRLLSLRARAPGEGLRIRHILIRGSIAVWEERNAEATWLMVRKLDSSAPAGRGHTPAKSALVREVDSMNAQAIYDGFIQFEDRSAELYLDLSVRFFDRPELSWFWVEMAMEEKQHAGMLQHCREAGVFATELPEKEQIQQLGSLFHQLRERTSAPALDLNGAFNIAIDLESSEINDIYRHLTAPIQGPAHIMRKKMELSVGGHFDKLARAGVRFGVSHQIQARLSVLLMASHSPHGHA